MSSGTLPLSKRHTLKARLWTERADWALSPPRPRCAVCGEPLPKDGACDMHEWLIRRGHVPKNQQSCIWHKFNCVLLHRACHERADGMKALFRKQMIEEYGRQEIEEWLRGLPLKTGVVL